MPSRLSTTTTKNPTIVLNLTSQAPTPHGSQVKILSWMDPSPVVPTREAVQTRARARVRAQAQADFQAPQKLPSELPFQLQSLWLAYASGPGCETSRTAPGNILFVQCPQTTHQHDINPSIQPLESQSYTPTPLQDSLPLRSSWSVKRKSTKRRSKHHLPHGMTTFPLLQTTAPQPLHPAEKMKYTLLLKEDTGQTTAVHSTSPSPQPPNHAPSPLPSARPSFPTSTGSSQPEHQPNLAPN